MNIPLGNSVIHALRRWLVFGLLANLGAGGLLGSVAFAATTDALNVQTNGLWRDVAEDSIFGGDAARSQSAQRDIVPRAYRTVALDSAGFLSALTPPRSSAQIRNVLPGIEVQIPLPDGTTGRYRVTESQVQAPELAAKFPEIKTWQGEGIDDPRESIFMDRTPSGFHVMILSPDKGRIFIDPYSRADAVHHISYFTRDHKRLTAASIIESISQRDRPATAAGLTSSSVVQSIAQRSAARQAGTQRRTYRLAVAVSGGYTGKFGGTVAGAHAEIVTAITRVNGIYNTELGVGLQLVANNDNLIFTNPSTDPFAESDADRVTAQTEIDARIGDANYDLGHVFNLSAGLARVGVVCSSGEKARGATGSSNPTGDAFWVDYVAHEMGHQMGADHSFNGNSGSCSGRTEPTTAYEPGSGSTIMGYAGICGTDNLQSNTDPYFHSTSFDQIQEVVQNGVGNTCGIVSNLNNVIPVPATGAAGFTIPANTPFTLTGSAQDGNGDALTYGWEEYDLMSGGPGGDPNDSANAPFFRSWSPSSSPTRTFPRMADILGKTTTIGEILPNVSRTMNFRMTARDNKGGVAYATYAFNVTTAAGAFAVTAPASGSNLTPNTTQTVTWNVANTNVAPVSCTDVEILLSTDGGSTFSTTLQASAPNNGSSVVNLPNSPAAKARIKVACKTHTAAGSAVQFFAVSDELQIGATTLISDGFEAAGWTTQAVGTTGASWSWPAAGSKPVVQPHGGTKLAVFNSYTASANRQARMVRNTGVLIPADATSAILSFWMYHDTGSWSSQSNDDAVQPQISTNGGTSWTNVGNSLLRLDGSTGWAQVSIDLTAYKGQTVVVGFLGTSQRSYDIHLDDLSLVSVAPTSGGGSSPSNQTIAFANPGNKAFGTSPVLTASASSNLTVSFSVASATASVCSITSGGTLSLLTLGTCTINANQAGNASFNAATQVSQSFTIVAGAQAALSASVSNATPTVGTTATLSTSGGSGSGAVSYASNSANCSISGSTLTAVTAGSCTITATKAADANFLVTTATVNITVTAATSQLTTQAITFGASPAVSVGASGTLTANGGGSNNPVNLASSTPSVCSVSGNTVTGIAAGTCTIAATQAGNANYSAAPQVSKSFTVTAGTQASLSSSISNATPTVGSTATLSTSGGSGSGAVSYASNSANCSISGSTLTAVTAGSCTITATKAADANFLVTTATVNITVTAATSQLTTQAITFGASPAVSVGASGTLTANGGGSNNPVNLASSTPSVCSVSGNTVTGIAAGTCTIAATQAGNANYSAAPQVSKSFTVTAGTQASFSASISNAAPSVGSTATLSTAGGSGSGAVSYSSINANCRITGSVLTAVAAGTCTITATKAADANFLATTATVNITVSASQVLTQAISFGASPAVSVGASGTLTATGGGSGNPVNLTSSTPSVCSVSGNTVTGIATGTCTITATQAGNTNYSAAQASQNLVIAASGQTTGNANTVVYVAGGTYGTFVTAGVNGAQTEVDASSGPPKLTITSGNVTIPCSATGNLCGASQSDLTVFAGESVQFDANGKVTSVQLGGSFVAQPMPIGSVTDSGFASLGSHSDRLNGRALIDYVVEALEVDNPTLGKSTDRTVSDWGALVIGFASGKLAVGAQMPIQVNPTLPNGVRHLPNGSVEVVTQGVVVRLVPTLLNINTLVADLQRVLPGSTLRLGSDGNFVISYSGAMYSMRPEMFAAGASAGSGNGFVATASGQIRYVSSNGSQPISQGLNPAVYSFDQFTQMLAKLDGTAAVNVQADGTLAVLIQGGTFILTPDYPVTAQQTFGGLFAPRPDFEIQGGKIIANYPVGYSQGFGFR